MIETLHPVAQVVLIITTGITACFFIYHYFKNF